MIAALGVPYMEMKLRNEQERRGMECMEDYT